MKNIILKEFNENLRNLDGITLVSSLDAFNNIQPFTASQLWVIYNQDYYNKISKNHHTLFPKAKIIPLNAHLKYFDFPLLEEKKLIFIYTSQEDALEEHPDAYFIKNFL